MGENLPTPERPALGEKSNAWLQETNGTADQQRTSAFTGRGKLPLSPRNELLLLTKDYIAYIRSPEWEAKRESLFSQRGKRCEACSFQKRLQVHHLKYDNLFREPDEDLMIFCTVCHELVERAKDDGRIPRRGDSAMLRKATLDALGTKQQSAPALAFKPPRRPTVVVKTTIIVPQEHPTTRAKDKGVGPRNPIQDEMMNDPEMMSALCRFKRPDFRAWARLRYKGRKWCSHMANAMALYDRLNRNGAQTRELEIPDGKVVLTARDVAQATRGGFLSERQQAILGIAVPMKKGWKASLIGRIIPKDMVERFILNLP